VYAEDQPGASEMRVGFTGTQNGMTDMQSQFVFNTMMDLEPTEAHHGCCIGADAQFHDMLGYSQAQVYGHPPINTSKMADCQCDARAVPKDYLERNRAIVDTTDVLIAAPKGPEELRSGTWSTVRYARKLRRPIYIVWPSGSMTVENAPPHHPSSSEEA
jgi:hypothetical protein